MEQDNKTMSAAELIRYIEDNNLELQMLDILLFNDCGFDFVPIYKPRITVDNNKKCCFIGYSIVDCDDINVLNSDYQMSSFDMPIGEQSKKWNRYTSISIHDPPGFSSLLFPDQAALTDPRQLVYLVVGMIL